MRDWRDTRDAQPLTYTPFSERVRAIEERHWIEVVQPIIQGKIVTIELRITKIMKAALSNGVTRNEIESLLTTRWGFTFQGDVAHLRIKDEHFDNPKPLFREIERALKKLYRNEPRLVGWPFAILAVLVNVAIIVYILGR